MGNEASSVLFLTWFHLAVSIISNDLAFRPWYSLLEPLSRLPLGRLCVPVNSVKEQSWWHLLVSVGGHDPRCRRRAPFAEREWQSARCLVST